MPALTSDPAAVGLRRRVADTPAGPILVHESRRTDGPATLLLHGAAGSWTTWTPLLAAAERADRPLPNVIAVDLPGWGASAGPVPAMATLADALAAVAAPHDTWRVVGHSLGGFVALDLAARRPDVVTAVGLVSPTGPAVVEAVRAPLAGGRRLPWFAGMLLAMRTLALLPGAGAPLMRTLGRLGAVGPLSAPLFAGRPDPSVVAALAEEVRPRAFTAAARAAARYDLGAWRGVGCPVRSVRGAKDVFVGDGDAPALAALLPDFAETVLAGAGHFAAIERPDAVLAALRPAVLP